MSRPFHSSDTFIEGVASQEATFPAPKPAPAIPLPAKTRFGYLFKHKAADRLETSLQTVKNLIELGGTMREKSVQSTNIPSAYTYFGQFIAHDVTFDPITKDHPLHPEIEPLSVNVVESIKNHRTGLLDLDSIYGPGFDDAGTFEVPRDNDNNKELRLGVAYRPLNPVRGTDVPRSKDAPFQARIGDPRNDENLPLSQLHLAFLKAHNLLVKKLSFEDARVLLKRRYQNLVVKDFLPQIVDQADLAEAKAKKDLYKPDANDLFIPIEFSAAAFRFGHSMIRKAYAFNNERGTVPLNSLFTPAAMGNYFSILADWVIDWSNFIDTGTNKARAFFPQLVEPLAELIDKKGLQFSLAVNDLLRGYLLGLPTGQALAIALDVEPLKKEDVLASAIDEDQRKILETSGFHQATPLWFYLFAEARQRRQAQTLGPVCGQLIALVLLKLAELSNYEDDDPWNETLGPKATFNLSEFIKHTLP